MMLLSVQRVCENYISVK